MRRLLALFPIFFLVLAVQAAEQWRSDRFRCMLTFPEGESWLQGTPVPLPAGEMIYIANQAGSKQSVAVIVIPKLPNNDLENAAVINRIMEPLIALQFQVISHAPVEVNGEKFLQLTGRRGESPTVNLICVARAAVRENTLYIALTSARGDEELATDKRFLRVLDTFTLLDPVAPIANEASGALVPLYRTAYLSAFIAVGALLLLALIAVITSRHRHA